MLIFHAGLCQDRAHIEVVAIIFETQRVASLHLFHKLAPLADQPGAPFFDDPLRVAVFAQILFNRHGRLPWRRK